VKLRQGAFWAAANPWRTQAAGIASLAGNIDSSSATTSSFKLKRIGLALLSLISRPQQLETIVQPVGMPTEAFAVSSIEIATSCLQTEGMKQ
jgi:hypothetical protein